MFRPKDWAICEIESLCDEPGWSYIFYDDQAVIGYEPFPENISIMFQAVAITVTVHNMSYPTALWSYKNVAPAQPPAPVTNDPVLGKWQFAFCLDSGQIVWSYTCEFDWEWYNFHHHSTYIQAIAIDLTTYNRDHDPDAHVVWGTDE